MQNLFLFNNMKDGTLPLQMVHGATDGRCRQLHLTRNFFSCSEHALIVARRTAWLKCRCTLCLIRIVIHVCDLIVCSLPFPHLVPFRVFLLSLLLPEPGLVPLPLPCGLHRSNIPLALRQMRSLALWPITRLSLPTRT